MWGRLWEDEPEEQGFSEMEEGATTTAATTAPTVSRDDGDDDNDDNDDGVGGPRGRGRGRGKRREWEQQEMGRGIAGEGDDGSKVDNVKGEGEGEGDDANGHRRHHHSMSQTQGQGEGEEKMNADNSNGGGGGNGNGNRNGNGGNSTKQRPTMWWRGADAPHIWKGPPNTAAAGGAGRRSTPGARFVPAERALLDSLEPQAVSVGRLSRKYLALLGLPHESIRDMLEKASAAVVCGCVCTWVRGCVGGWVRACVPAKPKIECMFLIPPKQRGPFPPLLSQHLFSARLPVAALITRKLPAPRPLISAKGSTWIFSCLVCVD